MTDFAAARRMMVDGQVRTADVTDLRLLAAMLEVPRERFFPEDKASLAYLDLQHQGLVVLMLLLALLMVSNVKYPKFPPVGLRTARGLFGAAVYLGILLGGILAPEYFLFPLGLFYVFFGIARTTVLGLMERPEPAVAVSEHLDDGDGADLPPITHERRGAWGDRRQENDDR